MFEATHFSLDYTIDVLNVLHSGLFNVNQSLLLVSQLLLDDTLSTQNCGLELFKVLILAAYLFAHDGSLMAELHLILLFSASDDVVHSS